MTETNTAVGGFLAIGLALCWFALLAWREHRRATRGMDLGRGAAHKRNPGQPVLSSRLGPRASRS